MFVFHSIYIVVMNEAVQFPEITSRIVETSIILKRLWELAGQRHSTLLLENFLRGNARHICNFLKNDIINKHLSLVQSPTLSIS